MKKSIILIITFCIFVFGHRQYVLGNTLRSAVLTNNISEAGRLIAQEAADPAVRDAEGKTAFHLAVLHTPMIKLLCEKRPDLINTRDAAGKTALDDAVKYGKYEQAKVLIEHDGRLSNSVDQDPAVRSYFDKNGALKNYKFAVLLLHVKDITVSAERVHNLAQGIAKSIRQAMSSEREAEATVSENLLLLYDMINNNRFRNMPIKSDDKQETALALIISDQVMLLQQFAANKYPQFKKLFTAFLNQKLSLYPEKTISEYCKELEASVLESDSTLLLDDAVVDSRDSCLSKLPVPRGGKINVTIMSLPTLLQGATIAEQLYKKESDLHETWNETCAFYSIFHLVNAWRYKDNPIQMLKSLRRNNFSNFLALTRSGFDVAQQLQKGIADRAFHERQKYYPTIINDLPEAAALSLGGLDTPFVFALASSYAFLSEINDSTFQYCPYYNAEKNILKYCNQPHDDKANELFHYIRRKLSQEAPFVFPLILYTSQHLSAALVYKFPTRSEYVVFFAESNGSPGYEDGGESEKGESYNFKAAFTGLFALLEERPKIDVHIQGPTEALTIRELCYVVQNQSQLFNRACGNVFDFVPSDGAKRKIIAQATPSGWWVKHITFCNNSQRIKQLLAAGADATIKDDRGYTMFHEAIFKYDPESQKILQVLCASSVGRAGIDIVHPVEGFTPLMIAVQQNKNDAVRLLLAAGARLDVRNKQGETAYHFAVFADNIQALELFCSSAQREAVNITTAGGYTPLDLAYKQGKREIIAVLERNGARRGSLFQKGLGLLGLS